MLLTTKDGLQVEICGTATLCFDKEGNCFQGSITAEDDTQFVISGTKSQVQTDDQEQNQQEQCGCNQSEGNGVPVMYDIRIVDCEEGEEYSIKRVHGRNGELCTFSCSSVHFTTDDVYKGHKADMVSQNCLGQKIGGNNGVVYRGPIKLSYVATPRNVQWVL